MKYFPGLSKILDYQRKRKTLYQLRLMSDRQLKDCGYSPELLSAGVKAWPWKELAENMPPLRFNQALNPITNKIERSQPLPEKNILAHQEAA